jgi:hypothetical protein
VATAEGSQEGSPEGHTEPAEPPAAPPNASDPAAQAAALRWFTALAAGDSARLLDMVALPFKTNGKDVTKKTDLSAMLTDLAGEGLRRPSAVQVVTAARLRAAIGKLPSNLEDSSGGQLYSVVAIGKDEMLILVLGQRGGGAWHPVGMVRR